MAESYGDTMRRTQTKTQTVDLAPSDYWTEEETAQTSIVRRPDNFVQASPAPRVQFMPPDGAQEALNVPSAATAQVQLRTTYSDRARGFAIVIAPVAVVTGIVALVAGVPVLSFAILTWFLTAFCLTWCMAYALWTFISPDGAAWLHVWQTWRMVSREQKFRHDRYWTSYHDARREDGRK